MLIYKKMIKGAFWIFLEKGAQQTLSLFIFAIIARMVGPTEYGLVALCGIVIMLMNNITSGLVDAVINMRIKDDVRLSTLFWAVLSSGVILSVLSFIFAHNFALIFNQEKLVSLLQIFSIMPFLFSLSAIPTALITASMDFKVFTVRTLVATMSGGGVGIYLAFKGWGSFSLAIQQIVSQCVVVAVVWISTSWRPRLLFNSSALIEMLRLGLGQTGTLFVAFLDQQVPRFVLGYFVGPTAVGLYSFVIRICGSIQDGLLNPVLYVLYPALVEIENDLEKKEKVVKETIFIVGLIIFPVTVGFICTSDFFIPLLFGDKWANAIHPMKIFSLTIFSFSFNLLLRNILRAHREIVSYLRLQVWVVFFSIVIYSIVGFYGIIAVVTTNTTLSILSLVLYSTLIEKKTGIKINKSGVYLIYPFLSSMVMGLTLFLLGDWLGGFSKSWVGMLLFIMVGFFAYLLCLCLLNRIFVFDLFYKFFKCNKI